MRILSCLLLMLLLTSCNSIIEDTFELELKSDQLVMFSILRDGEPITVTITRPVNNNDVIIDFNDLAIPDGEVFIQQLSRDSLQPLSYDVQTNSYFSRQTVEAGESYKILVNHPNYNTAESEWVTVPIIGGYSLSEVPNQTSIDNNCDLDALRCASFTSTKQTVFSIGSTNMCPPLALPDPDMCDIIDNSFTFNSERIGETGSVFSTTCLAPIGEIVFCQHGFFEERPLEFAIIEWSSSAIDFFGSLQEVESILEGFIEPKTTFSNISGGYGIVLASDAQMVIL